MRAGCVSLIATFTLQLAWASTVEEWQVVSTRKVAGKWGVSELRLFSDAACTKPLQVPNLTTFSSYPITEKVPTFSSVPAEVRGKDCVESCEGKSGHCKWCGEGNACCRKGFKSDPAECRDAEGFTTSSQHECVSAPQLQRQTHSGGIKALDGHLDSSYTIDCGQEGCTAGTLMLGGFLVQASTKVECIEVLQTRAEALAGSVLQASLSRRPPMPSGSTCPGGCRSGRYMEGSTEGICQAHLSTHGWCGLSDKYTNGGMDCMACSKLEAATPRNVLRVSTRETFNDGQVVVTKLQAPGFWRPTKPEPVQHVGEDCWGPCISGFCSWCGEGHACCKSGSESDLPECADATGFVALAHHECVALLRGQAGMFDGLPPWVVMAGLFTPWVTVGLGLFCYICRGRGACCCLCRKKVAEHQPKSLSGEVFTHRSRGINGDDELRKKVLREQAKKLDWLT